MLVRINDNFYVNPDCVAFVEKREDCVVLVGYAGCGATIRPQGEDSTVDGVYAYVKKQLGAKK